MAKNILKSIVLCLFGLLSLTQCAGCTPQSPKSDAPDLYDELDSSINNSSFRRNNNQANPNQRNSRTRPSSNENEDCYTNNANLDNDYNEDVNQANSYTTSKNDVKDKLHKYEIAYLNRIHAIANAAILVNGTPKNRDLFEKIKSGANYSKKELKAKEEIYEACQILIEFRKLLNKIEENYVMSELNDVCDYIKINKSDENKALVCDLSIRCYENLISRLRLKIMRGVVLSEEESESYIETIEARLKEFQKLKFS